MLGSVVREPDVLPKAPSQELYNQMGRDSYETAHDENLFKVPYAYQRYPGMPEQAKSSAQPRGGSTPNHGSVVGSEQATQSASNGTTGFHRVGSGMNAPPGSGIPIGCVPPGRTPGRYVRGDTPGGHNHPYPSAQFPYMPRVTPGTNPPRYYPYQDGLRTPAAANGARYVPPHSQSSFESEHPYYSDHPVYRPSPHYYPYPSSVQGTPRQYRPQPETLLAMPDVAIHQFTNATVIGGHAAVAMYCTAYDIRCTINKLEYGSSEHKRLIGHVDYPSATARASSSYSLYHVDNKLLNSSVIVLRYLARCLNQMTDSRLELHLQEVIEATALWRGLQSEIYGMHSLNIASEKSFHAVMVSYLTHMRPRVYGEMNLILANAHAFIGGSVLTWADFIIAGMIYNDTLLDSLYGSMVEQMPHIKEILIETPNVQRFYTYFLKTCPPANKYLRDRHEQLKAASAEGRAI